MFVILNVIYMCYVYVSLERETHLFYLLIFENINAYFLYDFREELAKANKELKHKLSYSGRVKTLCLQKNTALWIGTGGGHILLLDLSTRRIMRIIHNFCDSVRVMMTTQLGMFLSFRPFFFIFSKTLKILF